MGPIVIYSAKDYIRARIEEHFSTFSLETDTYGRLKGLVAVGASENGSDGTIRAASASLHSSVKLDVNFIDPVIHRSISLLILLCSNS
jgi:hypothetical protein